MYLKENLKKKKCSVGVFGRGWRVENLKKKKNEIIKAVIIEDVLLLLAIF